MRRYSTEPRPRKCVKGYGFLSFAREYKKQLLDTGLDFLEIASKRLAHEPGGYLKIKIADGEDS